MLSKAVTLSTEKTVTVGSMRWKAYKDLKTKILTALASDLPALLMGSADVEAVGRKLIDLLSEMNEEFVRGCLKGGDCVAITDADLTMADWAQLYAAAQEINPVAGILELEKNSPAGAAAMLLAPALNNKAESPPNVGGGSSSISLFDPGSGSAS